MDNAPPNLMFLDSIFNRPFQFYNFPFADIGSLEDNRLLWQTFLEYFKTEVFFQGLILIIFNHKKILKELVS
jgi:hypothetical protein